MRSDKERLDWLESKKKIYLGHHYCGEAPEDYTVKGYCVFTPESPYVKGKTVRAAIDAAIKAERKPKGAQ